MKPKNKRIYSADQGYLETINEEYRDMGFDTELKKGELTIFVYKRKKVKKKDDKAKPKRRNED